MSIPQPSKGQPLDSGYINKIVTAINDLYVKVSSKFSNSQISTKESGKQVARTTDLMLDAGYEIVTNSTSSSTSEIIQVHKFGANFKNPPIVVATPVIDNTITGKTINVYVRSVSSTSVELVVKFGTVDTTSITVNVIAIGLPSPS